MKKIHLFSMAALILLTGLICSCSHDDNKVSFPVSLKLDNSTARDSVYTGDTCTISGVATAPGKIDKIQVFCNFTWKGGTSEIEVTGAGIYSGSKGYDNIPDTLTVYHFKINLTNVKITSNLRIQLTDKEGNITSVNYLVKARPMNINSFPGISLGGWDSSAPSAFDAETGITYHSDAFSDPARKPLIDIFFDLAEFGDTDLDADHHDGHNRLGDMGARFAPTTFTASDFNKMKSDDAFAGMTGTLEIIPFSVGDVVFFQTKAGHKGLIKVVSMTSPTGDLVIDEKIQK